MSFGVSLKRERELRGVSLAEIAKSTKISVRLLEAIEKDRFDILPDGVFRKSFIKSYAKYLGMNPDQILHEYDLEVRPKSASQPAPEKSSFSFRDSSVGSRQVLLLALGILLLLVAALFGFWYLTRASREVEVNPATGQTGSIAETPSGQPRSETMSPQAASSPTAIPGKSTDPPPVSAGAAGNTASPVGPSALKVLGELAKKPEPVASAGAEGSTPLELTVEANNPVWVSVTAGESTLFAGLMSPADSKKFSLETPLRVFLSNAGGVRLQVNGHVFSSLGKSGARKTLEISAANYEQYLKPKTP